MSKKQKFLKARLPEYAQIPERPEDFLSPDQRMDEIAKILATITLRSIRKRHGTTPRNPE